MRVVIAGGHGQVALQLEGQLARAGHRAVGLVRNPDHVPDLERTGAEAVVLDMEKTSVDDLAKVVSGADAVVFAAGGGPNSGPARKQTVDRGAAVLLADAAEAVGVSRYLMVSSMGAEGVDLDAPRPGDDDVFAVYLRAKAEADADLATRDLDWTIVRPGRLTDVAGTGTVTLDPASQPRETPRADVAATLVAALDEPATIKKSFAVLIGPTPIAQALASL
ncbi:MAG TPA: NAD(P)-binding oxidoreductase [Nocardioidaceae bacterium]|nr:NAD(P)-binding oxidoreductase [Nocardioidaceae bacterium]